MFTKFITLFFIFFSMGFAQLSVELAFPNITFHEGLTDIQNAADGTNRLFYTGKSGRVWVLQNQPDVSSDKVFIDLRDRVTSGGERGLLGLAFHPDYQSNGYFYVNYTAQDGDSLYSVISRFSVSEDDPDAGNKDSELILLQFFKDEEYHHGGQMVFGPDDGYLYITTGDGGPQGDTSGYAQNLESLRGKLLRIDVDNTDANKNYSIPESNPFYDNISGFREEIFAYGFRNPWRFSIDPVTGKIWVADVGHASWEEINWAESGGNYGWNIKEGSYCYPSGNDSCDGSGLINPVWQYDHSINGWSAVIGGYVYRENPESDMYGKYIYGDFTHGTFWSLSVTESDTINEEFADTDYNIYCFGLDENNAIYASVGEGNVRTIVRIVEAPVSIGKDSNNPRDYYLKQNYPNPFNPKTYIEYHVRTQHAVSQQVNLSIYNLSGQKIATLVDEKQSAGNYKAEWDASAFSTGVYLYRLKTAEFTETRKMLLIK